VRVKDTVASLVCRHYGLVVVIPLVLILLATYYYYYRYSYAIQISSGHYTLGTHVLEIGMPKENALNYMGPPALVQSFSDSQYYAIGLPPRVDDWTYHFWDGSHFVLVFSADGDTLVRILHYKNLMARPWFYGLHHSGHLIQLGERYIVCANHESRCQT